jgi:tRNA(Ile)-lysidine synthase
VLKAFTEFTLKHWDKKSPLLLGLSGGPDSLSLYYLLLESRIPFVAAHVNHGWRKESDDEALQLKDLCKGHGVVFLEEKVTDSAGSNREERAREARFAFFKKHSHSFQALVLGHQADEQAETVLKRIFEGASLPQLAAMREVTLKEGVTIWRPLLRVRKREILDWLKAKEVTPFYDRTNDDPRFLRARQRHILFPFLSEHFGKEVTPSLSRLSTFAGELQDFLQNYLKPFRDSIEIEEDAVSLNLAGREPKTLFEWKAIIKDFFDSQKVALSHPTLLMIICHLERGVSRKQMIVSDKKVVIEKKRIAICKK